MEGGVETQSTTVRADEATETSQKRIEMLNEEEIKVLSENWLPNLGFTFSRKARGAEGEGELEALKDQPADFTFFKHASFAERKEVSYSMEEWRRKMEEYLFGQKKEGNRFLERLFGLSEEGRVSEAVAVAEKWAEKVDLNEIKEQIKQAYINPENQELDIKALEEDFNLMASFFAIFGDKHTRLAMAHTILSELRLEAGLTDEIKQKAGQELSPEAKKLVEIIDQLAEKGKEAEERAVRTGSVGREKGEPVQAVVEGSELESRVEVKENFPEGAAAAVLQQRGEQDLPFFFKLADKGIKVFGIVDGAGEESEPGIVDGAGEESEPGIVDGAGEESEPGRVSNKIAKYLKEELSGKEIIDEQALREAAFRVHAKILREYNGFVGGTVDVCIIDKKGRVYILHVGEGFAGRVNKEGSLERFEQAQPQRFVGPGGEPIRDKGGWKTPAIGSASVIRPIVFKLDEPPKYIVLASDGLGDAMEEGGRVFRLTEGDLREAVRKWVAEAAAWQQSQYGEEGDDVSAVILDLSELLGKREASS